MTNETTDSGNRNDKVDLLSKYTRKPYPALVKPELVESDDEEESGYRALIEHREKKGNAPRFRILDRTGQSYGCGYAYLLGWLFSPPETLSLYTTTHSFILTGKNLQRIEKALMRERVQQLREYHPEKDQMPTAGEPIILEMEIINRFGS